MQAWRGIAWHPSCVCRQVHHSPVSFAVSITTAPAPLRCRRLSRQSCCARAVLPWAFRNAQPPPSRHRRLLRSPLLPAADDPDLLRNRSLGDRTAVITAGVLANMALAFAICVVQVGPRAELAVLPAAF